MPVYRLFPVHSGHVIGPADVVSLTDDAAAFVAACAAATYELGIEVWEGARRVVSVPPLRSKDDTAVRPAEAA